MAAESLITSAELAERTGTTVEHVDELVRSGMLAPEEPGRHRAGDVHRVRIIDAFLDAGIPIAALRQASSAGDISFAYYDRLHPSPDTLSDRTYGAVRETLGERGAMLGRLFEAFGLVEPDAASRLPAAEEAFILALLEIASQVDDPQHVARVLRLFGDALRRVTEAVMTIYDEAVSRMMEPAEGLPSQEVFDRYLQPWMTFAQLAPQVAGWLTERHLSNAIDAYSVASTEHYLALGGYVAPRADDPPAVAFVDLSGFTRLAEERGDERVAVVALQFARLAEAHAEAHGGRVVKLLGDGALLRFPSATTAVDSTLALLDALGPAALPAGHAGIHAGPIIVRDGDIFGRTVNLAARLSDVADPGQLVATSAVAGLLPPGRHAIQSLGAAQLQGIDGPVELVRISRA
jgi:adenylate cyclase